MCRPHAVGEARPAPARTEALKRLLPSQHALRIAIWRQAAPPCANKPLRPKQANGSSTNAGRHEILCPALGLRLLRFGSTRPLAEGPPLDP